MTTSIPQTMQAWLQTSRGQPKDVLELDQQHAVPTPGDKEVLIKTKVVSLNPVGHKTMKFPGLIRKLPNIVEYDLSGVVVRSESANFRVGDEVFGIIPAADNMKTGRGALAQYAVVKEGDLAQKPTELSWEDAAGLPLVGCTAHGAIIAQGHVQAGQTIFINGGATSVGRIAIGIAKKLGATVIVSCSSASADTCKSLGADEIVDYKKTELPAYLAEHYSAKPVDLIVDLIGNKADLYGNSETYLREGGKYLLIGGQPPKGAFDMAAWAVSLAASALLPKLLGNKRAQFQFWLMDKTTGLPDLAKWAVDGTIKVQVDSVHKFDRAGVLAAYERIMTEAASGKVFIEVPQ